VSRRRVPSGAVQAVQGLFKRFVKGFKRKLDDPRGPRGSRTTPAKPSGPPRPNDPGFKPRPVERDRHGNLTDGVYRVSSDANRRHTRGSAPEGKSTYDEGVDPDEITLAAAQHADQKDLWTGEIPGQPHSFSNKAKVPFDQDIGFHAGSGQPTNVVNVYRKKNGTVHSSPGSRLD